MVLGLLFDAEDVENGGGIPAGWDLYVSRFEVEEGRAGGGM